MSQSKTIQICFNTEGNDKQLEVAKYWLDDTTTDIGYGGSKGSGKSFLGASLIFGDALIYPGTHYFIARKKLNDLRKYTQPTIKEVLDGWGIDERYYTFNGQDNYYTLYNGSKVYLLEAAYLPSDPDFERFGSIQMTRGWGEEIGEWHPKAKAMLQATIGRWKNDLYNLPGKFLANACLSKKAHSVFRFLYWLSFIGAELLTKGFAASSLLRLLAVNFLRPSASYTMLE